VSSIRPSLNTLLEENPLGRSVSMSRRREWRHPWFTTPIWQPKRKTWAAFVLAGFVNGRAPMVTTTAGELREARGTFFGQLVDARSGAAEIEQLARLAIGGSEDSGLPDNTRLDVPLYQNPPVGLHAWRAIGWDGTERAPQFFLDRGVKNPPPGAASQLQSGGRIALNTVTPPKGLRLLRACDIILHQPRTALSSSISIEAGFATGISNVRQTLDLREALDNDRLRIVTGAYNEIAQNNLNFVAASSLLASDYEEKTWDEIKVSTVYLLSPPNLETGSQPDATWQPFVAHTLFWNLFWAQPNFRTVVFDDIFRSLVGTVSIIGGGAGFGAVNFIAASINDATQAAFNLLNANSMAGTFWTPTGGGTTSTVPVTIPAPAPVGINKAANLAAKARAAAAEKINRRLDPPFPYEGRKFNLSLLNA
jgi:hypothetical protein